MRKNQGGRWIGSMDLRCHVLWAETYESISVFRALRLDRLGVNDDDNISIDA